MPLSSSPHWLEGSAKGLFSIGYSMTAAGIRGVCQDRKRCALPERSGNIIQLQGSPSGPAK
jgi:hypothetical protein